MKSASTTDQDALLRLILRGDIGGSAHPICRIFYKDTDDDNNPVDVNGDPVTDLDDQAEIDISDFLMTAEVTLRRDDRRSDLALLMPPAGSLNFTVSNQLKEFTPRAGNQHSDKLTLGRVVRVEMGFKVGTGEEMFDLGEFILDEPQFEVSPSATASARCRDKLSAALDQEISIRAMTSVTANDYILEVLQRVGIQESEFEFPAGLPTFATTPAFSRKKAIEILSEVMIRLQVDGAFRLIQQGGQLKLIEVPSTGNADYVFTWIRDLSKQFTRRERVNQARRRTTVKSVETPAVSTDASAGTGSGTEASLPVTITLSAPPYIRIFWLQPEGETLRLIETDRDTGSITFDRRNPAATGSWSVAVRGDRVTDSSKVGEAASGSLIDKRRGKTEEFRTGFLASSPQAQILADALQQRLGDPFREVDFGTPNAWVLGEINDLFRMVEKYSGDRDIYHVGQLRFTYSALAGAVRLASQIVGQFSGIVEQDQRYDKAFLYDRNRIYDERFPIGENDTEDRTHRGAVVVRTR